MIVNNESRRLLQEAIIKNEMNSRHHLMVTVSRLLPWLTFILLSTTLWGTNHTDMVQTKKGVHSIKNPNNSIQWTGATINTVTGCSKISAGCKHCYAEKISLKLQKQGVSKYKNGFDLNLHSYVIKQFGKWSKPMIVFVNSMSDLFQEGIPDSHIIAVFEAMNNSPEHQYQILTKRSKRLLKIAPKLTWSKNIWMGVSVENSTFEKRVADLKQTPAHIKFISAEPLIGPIVRKDYSPDWKSIDWCIIGGESPQGTGSRYTSLEWISKIVEVCDRDDVRVFTKQMGHRLGMALGMSSGNKKGDDIRFFPKYLKRFEFPLKVDMSPYLHCFE